MTSHERLLELGSGFLAVGPDTEKLRDPYRDSR